MSDTQAFRNSLMGPQKRKKKLFGATAERVAAATVADYGDVALAEYTQPFNVSDVQAVVLYLSHAGYRGSIHRIGRMQ